MIHERFYSRLTEVVSINPVSDVVFEYPDQAMRYEYKKKGVTPYIVGFENDRVINGHMNIILSNGDRSKQKDLNLNYYDRMFPADSHKRIRSVSIYYDKHRIRGFSFFDKEGAILYKMGWTAD